MGVSIRKIVRTFASGTVTRYEVVADLGPDPATGKRRFRTRKLKTEREAKRLRAQWLIELEAGVLTQRSKQTISELMDYWLATYVSTKSSRTYEQYAATIRLYIVPHLGAMKVQDLQPKHILDWLTSLRQAGRGTRTIQLAHERLSQALDQAMSLDLLARNVARRVKAPMEDDRAKVLHTWTIDEQRTFLAIAEQRCNYGPIWHLALATGLRRGELLGLRWQDVDLTKSELHIHQSAGLLGGKTVLGPTKTKASKGTVPMPGGIAEKLKAHGTRQKEHRLVVGDIWHDHGLVFPSEVGTPINPNNLIREFARLVALAGVPRIRIHDLRHTWASRGLNKGIPNVLISALARHGRVSTTTDIYGHADTDMLRDAAERSWVDLGDDRAAHNSS